MKISQKIKTKNGSKVINMTDSNQFFRNKINNIQLKKDIIFSINSWINKIYTKGFSKFELLEVVEITKEEALNKFDICKELKELDLNIEEDKNWVFKYSYVNILNFEES